MATKVTQQAVRLEALRMAQDIRSRSTQQVSGGYALAQQIPAPNMMRLYTVEDVISDAKKLLQYANGR